MPPHLQVDSAATAPHALEDIVSCEVNKRYTELLLLKATRLSHLTDALACRSARPSYPCATRASQSHAAATALRHARQQLSRGCPFRRKGIQRSSSRPGLFSLTRPAEKTSEAFTQENGNAVRRTPSAWRSELLQPAAALGWDAQRLAAWHCAVCGVRVRRVSQTCCSVARLGASSALFPPAATDANNRVELTADARRREETSQA
jgi:hypothetical protein